MSAHGQAAIDRARAMFENACALVSETRGWK